MNKNRIALGCAVALLCGFASCGGGTSSADREVPEVAVHVDSLPGDTLMLGYVGSITVRDSLLFLVDYGHANQAEALVQLYSYPALRPLCRFVNRGKGPNETLGMSGYVVDGDSVRVFVGWPPRMFVYGLADLVRGERLPARIIPYPEGPCSYASGFQKLDSGFVLTRFYGDPAVGRVIRIDSLGNVTGTYYSIPYRPEDLEQVADYGREMLATLWQAVAAASGETVVLGTKLGDVLEIYNLRDSSLNRIVRGPDGPPEVECDGNSIVFGVKSGYQALKIVGDRIYAMYRAERFKDSDEPDSSGVKGSTLRVFDLDGNWLKSYMLDRPLHSFDILSDGRTVVAGDPTAEYQLCTFTLPEE
ncbi:BF3164 family lipoprotein [uncultured Rikenella sp.]|uniref:BF3164 family lipoprotein n=1 Tax=uncultured Rikenella sp. TaxID=368003 RepID=UPI0025EBDB8A|nr:BF3164 family lipoprotein [uncultured Rikenella sp.]